MKQYEMTVTTSGHEDVFKPKPTGTLKYYYRVIRWLVKHRTEKNNRQKWRRMERELKV